MTFRPMSSTFRPISRSVRRRRLRTRVRGVVLAAITASTLVFGVLPTVAAQAAISGDNIALLALKNVGEGYCSKNTLGGHGFETSCSGEYWCSDFAKWVWAHNGVSGLSHIDDYAWSVYNYGQIYHTFYTKPAVGDLAVYSNTSGDHTKDTGGIHHTAVVTGWSDYGNEVTTVSGDWENHPKGTGTTFTHHFKVVNNGQYPSAPGYSSTMKMYIVGYVAPH